MDEVRFLAIGEAAQRVGREPQTVRRWANNGQVRRRQRGRIVEYHEADLLAVAGLAELDAKDREIARLRAALAQAQRDRAEAWEVARNRRDKVNAFQARARRNYGAYKEQIAALETRVQQGQVERQDLATRHTQGWQRLAEVERQVATATQQAQRWQGLYQRALQLVHVGIAQLRDLMGPLTARERKEALLRLEQELMRLEQEGR